MSESPITKEESVNILMMSHYVKAFQRIMGDCQVTLQTADSNGKRIENPIIGLYWQDFFVRIKMQFFQPTGVLIGIEMKKHPNTGAPLFPTLFRMLEEIRDGIMAMQAK